MIMVLPTLRGTMFTFAALGSLGIALVNVSLGTALTAALLSGFVAASYLMALFSLFRLRVERRSNADGVADSKVILPIVVINKSFHYRQSVVVSEKCGFTANHVFNCAVPPLKPYERLLIDRQVPTVKRGFFKLSRVSLLGGDPAGLFRRRRNFHLPGEIMIYPKAVPVSNLPIRFKRQVMPAPTGRLLGIAGQGLSFFGLREYRSTDEMRFIHWKATAAQGKLMVKEFEANTLDRVIILLDSYYKSIGNDPDDNNFEFLIKTAASIASGLAEMYCNIHFYTVSGSGPLIHLFGDAVSVKNQITDILANLEAGRTLLDDLLGEAMDSFPTNSIFYCLTMSEPKTAWKILELLPEYDIEVRWIYAPRQYFPVIDPNEPRMIIPGRLKITQTPNLSPFAATFKTDISTMLSNE
ncbi:MAG: DUF58 domain-containing protein [Victivallaceae bacterium]|nr:DUF58 domain-containing protein [Victivallaceae bacterium]